MVFNDSNDPLIRVVFYVLIVRMAFLGLSQGKLSIFSKKEIIFDNLLW